MKQVYVLSYNAGVLGVFWSNDKALAEKRDYIDNDYKGVKVEEFYVY